MKLQDCLPRLKSLLLMLSSDRDGEVVAAARAVERTLKSAGADWHDLAGLLTTAPAKTNNPTATDWRAMRDYCAQHSDLLQQRERDLVDTLQRWKGAPTDKQLAWLAAIYQRLHRRHAA